MIQLCLTRLIDHDRQARIAALKGIAVKPLSHGVHLDDACGFPFILYPKSCYIKEQPYHERRYRVLNRTAAGCANPVMPITSHL